MIKVLSIAGSDPSSGAGIQADLKTFHALGVFGMALPAALTAQSSSGVSAVEAVSSRALSMQLRVLLADMRPHAIKTGMLLSGCNVLAVARAVRKFKIGKLIIDPVLRSSSGRMLLQQDAFKVFKEKLLPLALIATPNVPEAEILSGLSIKRQRDLDRAAARLLDLGPSYILIKGGHRTGPATDTLYGDGRIFRFSAARKRGEFHGTGCVLSSAIAVFMARGYPVEKAVDKAKQFVERMLKTARPAGKSRTKYFQMQNANCKLKSPA